MQALDKLNIGRSTTPVRPRPDAPFQETISCRSPAASLLQKSGNFLSHLSELISRAAARLTTIRMETVTRPMLIPEKDCTWTSMLQLQAILLTAEPAIEKNDEAHYQRRKPPKETVDHLIRGFPKFSEACTHSSNLCLQSCIGNLAGRGIEWLADTSPGFRSTLLVSSRPSSSRSAVLVQCSSFNAPRSTND